jgi:CheY-like chemotaxis protein
MDTLARGEVSDLAKILVVDDDPDVLSVVAETIERFGYSVLQANGGRQAIELLESEPSVSLMLTDIMMPGMTGLELADVAKQMKPSLRIIYTSAYISITAQKFGLRHGPFLPKPWRLSDLREKISGLLGRSGLAD